MSTVYWGDAGVSSVDGNWNNAANWFSSVTPDGISPGTALGRVPQPGDSVMLTECPTSATITTGPTGGWNGPIGIDSTDTAGGTLAGPGIAAGAYRGAVTLTPCKSTNATISGGTFSGAVALQNAPAGMNSLIATISGGLFTGTVSRTNPNSDGLVFNGHTAITGGTYSPSSRARLLGGSQIDPSTVPADPGFAVGGGQFAPVLLGTGFEGGVASVGVAIRTAELELSRQRREIIRLRERLRQRPPLARAMPPPASLSPAPTATAPTRVIERRVEVPVLVERVREVLVPSAPIVDPDEDELAALLNSLEQDRRLVLARILAEA